MFCSKKEEEKKKKIRERKRENRCRANTGRWEPCIKHVFLVHLGLGQYDRH